MLEKALVISRFGRHAISCPRSSVVGYWLESPEVAGLDQEGFA